MRSFIRLTNDQYVLVAKELGMIFNYMNDDEVWGKFCDTYEAIWSLKEEFDSYYATRTPLINMNLPKMKPEGEAFIRAPFNG